MLNRMAESGSIMFDERGDPLFRIRCEGVPAPTEWSAGLDHMVRWVTRREAYAVLVDAQMLGMVPATYRRELMDWINRYRLHLRTNCVGCAVVLVNAAQRGLLTAVLWVAPAPAPLNIVGEVPNAERWLKELLRDAGS